MCGGDLEVTEDMRIAKCPYCGATQTLPILNDDKIANLYDRANHYRRINEFDKAMMLFETILSEDNTDSETYWSILLCRYGIKYVEDAVTHTRVPTVNRTQYTSIFNDEDYVKTINLADSKRKPIYEQEAKTIDKIQQGILDISKQEKPFDVFICYKETDSYGQRTEDSAVAYDLYDKFAKEGLKVFFSRVTLEDKLGVDYEPYIFSAINSSKVMVVVGTSKENFEAPWVKNEWSRYLKLFNNGEDKLLIPTYKNMDPYDLPIDFSKLQALDLSKIGAVQDLIHIVKKNIDRSAQNAVNVTNIKSEVGILPLDKLLQNGETALKINNYELAENTYTQVTQHYPEEYKGWWGLILSKTNDLSLVSSEDKIETYYSYVKKLYNGNDFERIEELYLKYLKKYSVFLAKKEVEKVNKIKSSYLEKNKREEHEIKTMEKGIASLNSAKQSEISSIDNRKKHIKENLARKEANQSKHVVLKILGIALWGIGSLIFFCCLPAGSPIMFLGIIMAIIGIKITWDSKLFNSQKEIDKLIGDLSSEDRKIVKIKQKYSINLQKNYDSINKHKLKIREYETKIQNCDSYLGLGLEKIADYFYAKSSNAIGVSNEFNHNTVLMREKIFGKELIYSDSDTELTVRFECPVCKNIIAGNRDKMLSDGFVLCSLCGAKIEIENSNN